MEELPFLGKCMKILGSPQDFFKVALTKEIVPAAAHAAVILVITTVIGSLAAISRGVIGSLIALPATVMAGGDLGAAFVTMLISLVGSVVGGVGGLFIGIIVGVPVMLIVVFIGSLIAHLFLYLFGARGGWERTVKIVYYMSTYQVISSLLGLIPFLGSLLAGLFSFYIVYRTLQAYSFQHQMSMLKAFAAVLAPIVIVALIAFVIAAIIVLIGGGVAALAFLVPLLSKTN